MARFAEGQGQRFAALRGQLAIPRDSLSRALETALAAGWIGRNPGHGHPLRPEYVLMPEGKPVAALALRASIQLEAAGIAPDSLTRWSLPALLALHGGHHRFNELTRQLAPATPRALSQTLRVLAANDLIERTVDAGFPPTSRYRLTARGRRCVPDVGGD